MLKYDIEHMGAAAGSNKAQSRNPFFNHNFEHTGVVNLQYRSKSWFSSLLEFLIFRLRKATLHSTKENIRMVVNHTINKIWGVQFTKPTSHTMVKLFQFLPELDPVSSQTKIGPQIFHKVDGP